MTTATMTIDARKMGTAPRPRRSLEELVGRLMSALTFVETPTSEQVPTVAAPVDESVPCPRRSLEELVDNLMSTLTFIGGPSSIPRISVRRKTTPSPGQRSMVCAIHEARRLRQSGDLDGALETLDAEDLSTAEPHRAKWAYTEWSHLVKLRFGDASPLVYSQGTGRAAALIPGRNDSLEVVAVLGMKWRPGKLVSRRSLRGLRPLTRGGVRC